MGNRQRRGSGGGAGRWRRWGPQSAARERGALRCAGCLHAFGRPGKGKSTCCFIDRLLLLLLGSPGQLPGAPLLLLELPLRVLLLPPGAHSARPSTGLGPRCSDWSAARAGLQCNHRWVRIERARACRARMMGLHPPCGRAAAAHVVGAHGAN